MRRVLVSLLVILSILLAGCSQAQSLLPKPTGMTFPTLTPRPTLTYTPTQTDTPQPTLTVTPVVAALAGTPFAGAGQAITVENGGQVALLARWGMGIPYVMRWSADGSRLAVGSSRGVWVYRVEPASLEWSRETGSPCRALAFSPDGERLAAGLEDGRMLLLSKQGQVLQEWAAHAFVVLDVAWSPDGKLLASTSWDKHVKVWDAGGKLDQPVYSFNGLHSGFERLAFNADGTELQAVGGAEGLQAWRLKDGKSMRLLALPFSPQGSPAGVSSLSANGERVLLEYPGLVRVQRMLNGATLAQVYQTKEPFYGSAMEASGERLALSLKGRIVLHKSAGGQELTSLLADNPLAVYQLLAFSPDGLHLAAAGSGLAVWRTDLDARPIELLPQGWLPGLVTGTARREDGWVSGALLDGSLWELNVADGGENQLAAPYKDGMSASAWDAAGKTALLAGLDRSLQLWTSPGDGWQVVKVNKLKSLADCLALSRDGSKLAVGSSGQVLVYSQFQDKPEALKIAQQVVALRYLADGRLVITLLGGEVWLWDGPTPSLKLSGVNPAFSADGSLMALAHFDWDSASVNVLRVGSAESLLELGAEGRVMAFSPDNSLLATVGRRLQIWSVADGKLLSDLPVNGSGKMLYFTTDGARLVMVAGDGVISIWGVP